MNNLEKSIMTFSGMWALWDYENYKNLLNEEDWDKRFINDEDIIKEIITSKFVPIYVHSGGNRVFKVKINETLNEREIKYVIAKSNDYLLDTDGIVCLSGIENILGDVRDNECIKLNLEKGKYCITIYIIAWDQEPNIKSADGFVSSDALSDFIVCINSAKDENKEYCKSLETFNK